MPKKKQTPGTRTRLNPVTAETEHLPNRAYRRMMAARARRRAKRVVKQEVGKNVSE